MSTRYVWGKYKTTQVKAGYEVVEESISTVPISGTMYCAYGDNAAYTLDQTTGKFTISGKLDSYDGYGDTGEYFTAIYMSFEGYRSCSTIYYSSYGRHYYNSSKTSTTNWDSVLTSQPVYETGKGSLYGYVSSPTSTTYPTDGISGSYWYVYLGSDNIDPTAVGYSAMAPKGGSPITITVTPRANTYGGTISYQYEVQLDGGSWTNIGSTTATSKSYTIPKGTKTFRARVKASDNMGFTSADYVTGAALTVKNSSVYAGVSGVVRNPDTVVCIAGVVRSNVSCYACVDGVIRQC